MHDRTPSIVANLTKIGSHFSAGAQQDPHKFMRSRTENMHIADLRAGGHATPPHHRREHTGLLHSIFGGYLRSRVQCEKCNFSNDTYDAFLDLSLEVDRAAAVPDALQSFTNTDILEGDNKFECSKCGKKTRATKRFTRYCTTRVLQLHPKRFGISEGGDSTKILHHVTFLESLAVDPFTSQGEDHPHNTLAYALYTVIVHTGSSL